MEPVLFGYATRIENIIAAMVSQVNNVADFYYCFPILQEDKVMKTPPADVLVGLGVKRFQSIEPFTTGGGTLTKAFQTDMGINFYQRLELDSASSDMNLLTNASNGIFSGWRNILKAFEQWAPPIEVNSVLWSILIEPMRCMSIDTIRYNQGWGKIESTWEMKFIYDFS